MRSDWTLPMSSAVTGFPSRTITAIAAEAGLSAHELGALAPSHQECVQLARIELKDVDKRDRTRVRVGGRLR